jgi:septal ring factor EnvC (AmiA/AmiB activator)|tara:strand:- start:528 stop:863 length:336 start_codon:yes stop_codon:yes gene_type:complete
MVNRFFTKMNLIDLLKKNIVMVPVVASLIVGTFTGVRYIVNLTDSINGSVQEIVNLQRDLEVAQKAIVDLNTRLASAEATWQMAENLYRQLADQVREHDYDIKDINRDLNN